MTAFKLSTNTLKKIDELYRKQLIDSKEVFVQTGLAIGILTNKKKKISKPKHFHTLAEIDSTKSFTVIVTSRNLDLVTEEDVVRELEMYAEGGIGLLINEEIKGDRFNRYKLYKKYSD